MAEISFCDPYFLRILPVTSLAITSLCVFFLVVVNVSLIFAVRAWRVTYAHYRERAHFFDAGDPNTGFCLSLLRSLSALLFCLISTYFSFCISLYNFLYRSFLPAYFFFRFFLSEINRWYMLIYRHGLWIETFYCVLFKYSIKYSISLSTYCSFLPCFLRLIYYLAAWTVCTQVFMSVLPFPLFLLCLPPIGPLAPFFFFLSHSSLPLFWPFLVPLACAMPVSASLNMLPFSLDQHLNAPYIAAVFQMLTPN